MKKQQKVHQGRNVKRFREMLGIKQECLAAELGDNWSQKKVSELESKEQIAPITLERVADVLNISIESIQTFTEDSFKEIIAVIQGDNSIQYTFNPIDKLIETYERKKNLYERLLLAYEQLIASEREKSALLRSFIEK